MAVDETVKELHRYQAMWHRLRVWAETKRDSRFAAQRTSTDEAWANEVVGKMIDYSDGYSSVDELEDA